MPQLTCIQEKQRTRWKFQRVRAILKKFKQQHHRIRLAFLLGQAVFKYGPIKAASIFSVPSSTARYYALKLMLPGFHSGTHGGAR